VGDESAAALRELPSLAYVDFGRSDVGPATADVLAALPPGQLRGVGLGDTRVSERCAGRLSALVERGCILTLHDPTPLISTSHTRHAAAGNLSRQWLEFGAGARVRAPPPERRAGGAPSRSTSRRGRDPTAARVVGRLTQLSRI
jgi:hypothetical protein